MKDQSKRKRTQEFYNSLKPLQTTSLSPRRGYYFIQSVRKETIGNHYQPIEIASALWKFDEKEKFDSDFIVEVQLQTFRLNAFMGSDKLLDGIVHKIIHVKSAYVESDEKSKRRVLCHWRVLQPKMTDFNDDFTISAEEQNLQARIEKEMSQQDDDELMIANALLDQYEYFYEWDNYESNMYLDMEESKLQMELSKDNNSSFTR